MCVGACVHVCGQAGGQQGSRAVSRAAGQSAGQPSGQQGNILRGKDYNSNKRPLSNQWQCRSLLPGTSSGGTSVLHGCSNVVVKTSTLHFRVLGELSGQPYLSN